MATSITSLTDAQLSDLVGELGGKPFQARQLAHWVYKHGAPDYDACRNLPGSLLDKLRAWGPLRSSEVVQADRSADGTDKLLVRFADGETVECVSIPDRDRHTPVHLDPSGLPRRLRVLRLRPRGRAPQPDRGGRSSSRCCTPAPPCRRGSR